MPLPLAAASGAWTASTTARPGTTGISSVLLWAVSGGAPIDARAQHAANTPAAGRTEVTRTGMMADYAPIAAAGVIASLSGRLYAVADLDSRSRSPVVTAD